MQFLSLPGLLLFTVLLVAHAQVQVHTNRTVLFLGNSYTGVNNLPQLVADLATAAGDTIVVDSYAPGGATFARHCTDPVSLAKISSQQWDCVVIQAQSQEPAFPPEQVAAQTLPYAITLDSLICANDSCTITVMYETWGRKNGDQQNCAFYPPLCTYEGMQDRLRDSYKLFADTCHTVMAPVGEAWRSVVLNNPDVNLYQQDESHPTIEGSFLAACVLYEVIYEKRVVSNPYHADIEESVATMLQETASTTVRDSAMVWNIDRFSRCNTLTSVHDNNNSSQELNIYPNPTNGTLYLSSQTTGAGLHCNYLLIDSLGNVVADGETTNVITVDELPVGMYQLFLQREGRCFYKTIVVGA